MIRADRYVRFTAYASNSKLKQNLEKQVEVYKAAAETDRAIKVIMYFTNAEYEKVVKVLN